MPSSPIFATEQLNLQGIAIEVQYKAIKNINLKVCPPDGRVCITAPIHADRAAVHQFAASKLPWIERKRTKFQTYQPEPSQQFISGETHQYRGIPHRLHVHPCPGKPRIELRDNDLHLYVRPTATAAERERVLYGWYRQQLKAIAPPIISKWEQVMDVNVREMRIKRMKTRWGTCNIKERRIWLNLELIKAPPECLEYVIVHEMIHFFERLHSDRFYRLVEHFLPTYKMAEKELRNIQLS